MTNLIYKLRSAVVQSISRRGGDTLAGMTVSQGNMTVSLAYAADGNYLSARASIAGVGRTVVLFDLDPVECDRIRPDLVKLYREPLVRNNVGLLAGALRTLLADVNAVCASDNLEFSSFAETLGGD